MAFHHPNDMQAFHRMHNVKKFPSGPHTSWPHRAEMGVRLFKRFHSATRGYSLQEFGQGYSVTDYTCPVDAQGSDGEKHTGNFEWRNAGGVSHGKETKEISCTKLT